MPSRCLNKVSLIGNLTRDPELRYTPGGMAVTSFGLATNRVWVTKQGERKEDAQFHRIVAWNKLAELCSQLLAKGRRVFVEGRIQYREITDQEGNRKQITEIVIDDMMVLDSRPGMKTEGAHQQQQQQQEVAVGDDMAAPEMGEITIPDDFGDIGGEAPAPAGEQPADDTAKKDEIPF
ncbi:MAG: single-stranded DNA-binding protein [Candidatus Shapirobacteria bacterium]